eukprot:scpid29080/ scgid3522/ Latrophilin-2; Calcium-independent alpha-latrotoxin receptor 2; Latrophilin homolog 1; Lectomedin-1
MALAKARAQLLAVLSACSLSLLSCAVDVVSANSAGDGQQVSPKANPCACLNNGVCDPRSGYCSCLNNFAGAKCEACAFGYSGPGCFVHCSCKNGAECTPGTSVCQCRPGTFGAACEKKCSPGAWGAGCTNKCRCQNGAQCDGGTGCQCVLGYTGRYCNTRPICPLLTLPSNLLLEQSGGNGYLNVTTTRCPDNWLWVSGSHQRVCQDDGTWSGPAASCQPPSTNSPGTTAAPQVQMCSEATIDGLQGKFVWPVTIAGVKRTIVCPVLVADEPVVLAERKCAMKDTRARWENPEIEGCPYAKARTRKMQRLVSGELKENRTLVGVGSAASDLSALLEEDGEVTSADAGLSGELLGHLVTSMVSLLMTTSSDEAIVKDTIPTFLAVFDTVEASASKPSSMDAGAMKQKQSDQRELRGVLEDLALAVPLAEEQQTFSFQSKRVIMSGVCPKLGDSYLFTVENARTGNTSTGARSANITTLGSANATDINTAAMVDVNEKNDLMFTFPSAAVQKAKERHTSPQTTFACQAPQISLVSFPSEDDFNSSDAVSGDQVATSVVAASVGSREDSLQLGLSQVQMTMPIHLASDDLKERNLTCRYWNETTLSWRQDGCRLVNVTRSKDGEMMARCECNHLTHFAVLVTPPNAESVSASAADQKALFFISVIGCSLSVVCLTLTVFFIQCTRNQKRTLQHQLTTCLSVSLLLALLLYIANALRLQGEDRWACFSFAILLHYFLLAAFGFTLVMAYYLYRRLIAVLVDVGETFLQRSITAVCVGCAALVGVNVAAFKPDVYGSSSGGLCFLSVRLSFYITFIAPIVLTLLTNACVLVVSMNKVRQHYKNSGSDKRMIWILTKMVFSMTFLLGLTWLFGAVVTIWPHVVFQYIFTILNTLQGVGVFVFHLMSNPDTVSGLKSTYRTIYRGTGSLLGRVTNFSSAPSPSLSQTPPSVAAPLSIEVDPLQFAEAQSIDPMASSTTSAPSPSAVCGKSPSQGSPLLATHTNTRWAEQQKLNLRVSTISTVTTGSVTSNDGIMMHAY